MIGECKKCPLPGLYANLAIYKEQAQMAKANIEASGSPTEAEPYIKAKEQALINLETTQNVKYPFHCTVFLNGQV